jgi:hypothetical protein
VQHVKRMERAGLLVGLRDGKHRVYGVQPDGLEPLERWLAVHRQPADLKRSVLGRRPRKTRENQRAPSKFR